MGQDDDPRWLGEDMIQQAYPRITVPLDVVDREIVEGGKRAFWAVDDNGVLLSKDRELFEGDDHVRLIGYSSVSDNQEVTFPQEIAQRDGFGPGEILHFLTTEKIDAEKVCRVVPEELADR